MARSIMALRDYSGEVTTLSVNDVTLTAANFDAQIAAWTALRDAIEDLTIGQIAHYSIAQYVPVSALNATNPFAQRESKWLVNYVGDVSGKKYSMEIGTADLGGTHLIEGTDNADLSDADWQAFITAFEAFVKAPDDISEAVTVTGARFVGRSS